MFQPHPIEYVSLYMSMHRLAQRFGLPKEDAEDCAMEFILRSLKPSTAPAAEQSSLAASPALLRRCAINYLLNFRRARRRRQQRGQRGETAERSPFLSEESLTDAC